LKQSAQPDTEAGAVLLQQPNLSLCDVGLVVVKEVMNGLGQQARGIGFGHVFDVHNGATLAAMRNSMW
jgi:hypothetical protein